MKRRSVISIILEVLVGVLLGAAIMASFLFIGLRVKAAPRVNDLVTIDRDELEDMRNVDSYIEECEGDFAGPVFTAEDYDLLAALIWCEAGDQPFYGKRLVADVVLNRMYSEDPYWPDTIAGVIFQPGQFTVVSNGAINHATPDSECYDAASLALDGDRCDTQIMFFSMYYCANGTFAYQYGDHYFGY